MTETTDSDAAKPEALWRVSGDVRILALGALLSATAFFAAVPFLSLYLEERTSLPKPVIGGVVGGVALLASVGGLVGGIVTDRYNSVHVMQAGLVVTVLVYVCLAMVGSTAAIVGLILLLGIGRLLLEPAGKKLLSLAGSEDGRIFRLRYVTLCGGAIAGPLLGSSLYELGRVAFFAVPAALYGGYLLLISVRLRSLGNLLVGTERSGSRFMEALGDRRLQAAIGAGAAIFFVFSQLESMVPLYIRERFGAHAISYFTWLLVANAALALVLQPPIDRIARWCRPDTMVWIGCAGFASSLLLFGVSSLAVVLLYVGIVLWTVGQAILFPLPDIAVHRLAADDQKGAYFGLAELRYVGFFLGPVVGGWLLDAGTNLYFGTMAVASFACLPMLRAATNMRPATPRKR